MIGFYFNGTQLPVNPEKITIKRQGNNKRTEVVLLGEVNILRLGKLASISFDFLLPGHDSYPFIVGPWEEPESLRQLFDDFVNEGNSVRFTVSEIGINQRVSVEDFSAEREAGDHESLKCSISLLEYRNHGAKTLVIPTAIQPTATPTAAQPTRPVDKPKETAYTIKAGDTLWAIAQKHLGDGSRYPEIARLNNIPNPNLIYAGNTLKLP